jgi:hypothetical protein
VNDGAASSTRGFGGCEGPSGSVPYATGRVENALRFSTLHPAPAAREIGRRLWGAVGWMTAPPHPRVGSAAARVRQARCLTQRGAWKTLCGFPPYIRRLPPGRSGGACGGRRVDDGAASSTRGFGGCEGPPGSVAYATGRVENALRFSTLHPVPGARCPVPGRSGGACWVFGRRVDDGAASSTRGFGGCEGPPGSVPFATGRVENASRFSTLHPAPAAREIGRRLWGAVGWMTAPPHPRVGSAAGRVRQARCLTQRGAWKTRCGFPPYIRRLPPGRSGGACGGP